jgi:indole-3-glycerol phosphate synthase
MTSGTFLEKILPQTRKDLEDRKQRVPFSGLESWLEKAPVVQDFMAALSGSDVKLISEIKKASPSKGQFVDNLDVAALARLYAKNGAAAISVLTDTPFFQGTLEDMSVARSVAGLWELPVLRKDFIVDPYQILESRAWGADAILLIVAILDEKELVEYIKIARGLGMEPLVETHTAEEINVALGSGADVIGINNRDLSTFITDLGTTVALTNQIPEGKIIVSESGISTAQHVRQLKDVGVNAVLVGEALITASDRSKKVRELTGKSGRQRIKGLDERQDEEG